MPIWGLGIVRSGPYPSLAMSWRGVMLLSLLGALSAHAQSVDGGRTSPPDPELNDLSEEQREDRLMRALAFDARATLERDLAAHQRDGDVKRQLLETARRLSALARRERCLAGDGGPSCN